MTETPKWLKRIQENSWEPELLISGGAFFTLLTLGDNFVYWFRDIRELMGIHFPGMNLIVFFVIVAMEGITFLFLFHLLIRAYWTGLIGISYVFPKGIKLNDKKPLLHQFKYAIRDASDLTGYIEKIETVASLVFGITIRFVMSAIAMAITLTAIALIIFQINYLASIVTLLLVGSILIIYVIDILTDMGIRRSPTFGRYYYPLYRFLDIISFSFVFRPITQVLLSNLKPKKILPIALLIMIPSFFSTYNVMTQTQLIKPYYAGKLYDHKSILEGSYIPYHYLNQWEEGNFKPRFQLGRDIVEEYPTLMIFIEYTAIYDDSLVPLQEKESITIEDFKQSFRVLIDDTLLDLDELTFGKNPKTDRLGLIGYFDMSDLKAGKHLVTFEVQQVTETSSEWIKAYPSIPFWKD